MESAREDRLEIGVVRAVWNGRREVRRLVPSYSVYIDGRADWKRQIGMDEGSVADPCWS